MTKKYVPARIILGEYGEGIEYVLPKNMVNEFLSEQIRISKIMTDIENLLFQKEHHKKQISEQHLDDLRTKLESEQDTHYERWRKYQYSTKQEIYIVEP